MEREITLADSKVGSKFWENDAQVDSVHVYSVEVNPMHTQSSTAQETSVHKVSAFAELSKSKSTYSVEHCTGNFHSSAGLSKSKCRIPPMRLLLGLWKC